METRYHHRPIQSSCKKFFNVSFDSINEHIHDYSLIDFSCDRSPMPMINSSNYFSRIVKVTILNAIYSNTLPQLFINAKGRTVTITFRSLRKCLSPPPLRSTCVPSMCSISPTTPEISDICIYINYSISFFSISPMILSSRQNRSLTTLSVCCLRNHVKTLNSSTLVV